MNRFWLLVLLWLALCSLARATEESPPKQQVIPGIGIWQQRSEEFRSTGEANQRFSLSSKSIIQGSSLITVAQITWSRVASFMDSTSDSPHFMVTIDDSGVTWVNFGDGIHGAVPPEGESVSAQYRAVIPEPSGVLALSVGLLGLLGIMCRRKGC